MLHSLMRLAQEAYNLLFPSQEILGKPLLMGWSIAVPIVASVISGILSNKGKKAQQKAAEKAAAERRAYAMKQLSPEEISKTAAWLFPGLLKAPGAAGPRGSMLTGRHGIYDGPGFSMGSRMGLGIHGGGPDQSPFAPGAYSAGTRSPGNSISGSMTAGGARGEIGGMNVGGVSGIWGSGITARAAGGPVSAGQPTIVGEKGPELLVPQQPGTVIPNPGTPNPDQPGPAPTSPGVGGPLTATPPPSGAMNGATATPMAPPGTGSASAGGLVVQRMMDYLKNPGQIDSSAYEREQEQVNQGLNYAQRGISGELAGHGVDPNTGYGQMLSQSAALNAMKMKNEANRDFTQMSETMRRTDIDRGTQSYLNFLSTIFGINNARANTASSAGSNIIPQFGDPYAGWASFAGMAGQTLGDYFKSKGK